VPVGNGRLISGDTLFLDGCGRTDLPGSDPQEMYRTLTQRLSAISDDTTLFPGHLYSADPSAPWVMSASTHRALVPASAEQVARHVRALIMLQNSITSSSWGRVSGMAPR